MVSNWKLFLSINYQRQSIGCHSHFRSSSCPVRQCSWLTLVGLAHCWCVCSIHIGLNPIFEFFDRSVSLNYRKNAFQYLRAFDSRFPAEFCTSAPIQWPWWCNWTMLRRAWTEWFPSCRMFLPQWNWARSSRLQSAQLLCHEFWKKKSGKYFNWLIFCDIFNSFQSKIHLLIRKHFTQHLPRHRIDSTEEGKIC